MKERIVHAAVIAENGWVIFGQNHGHCFMKAQAIGLQMKKDADAQGFVTSRGRFVTRKEAGEIALEAGQIDRETPYLFSEDLWDEEYRGKYDHDEIRGYVLRRAHEDDENKPMESRDE